MNCAEFRELIQDLAREESSADAAVINALNHAESCRSCDALLREAEKLTASLRSLASQHELDTASPTVEVALLGSFRRLHAPAHPWAQKWIRAEKPTLRKTGSWLAVSTVGLAAAVLLGLFLSGYRPATSPVAPAPEAPRETNRPVVPQRATWADYAADGETAEQAEAAYIPLAADFDPEYLEGGAIVRVVLSRPALESLGVPMNAGGDGQMVADMVVSNDGTPEAIRVVDWQAANIQ